MIRGIGRLRRVVRRINNLFVPPAIILLYHRVVELPSDPQLLSVTPKHFAEDVAILRKRGYPIRFSELGQALRASKSVPRGVAVTFDDGYADNIIDAKPVLERYDVPATVFVTAGYVGSQREFWYDDLERIFLCPGRLPKVLWLKEF